MKEKILILGYEGISSSVAVAEVKVARAKAKLAHVQQILAGYYRRQEEIRKLLKDWNLPG